MALRTLTPKQALEEVDARRRDGRLDCARAMAVQIVDQAPDFGPALHMLGLVEYDRGDNAAGEALMRKAIRLLPDSAEARANLGRMLTREGRYREASDALEAAHRLAPGNADIARLLAATLLSWARREMDAGRLDEALAGFTRATQLDPDFAKGHTGRGFVLYMLGDWPGCFREYEWRWQDPDFPNKKPPLPGPAWDGGDLTGKTIALYTEQGLGDTLQFCRYVPLLKARGARTLLGVQAPLVRLMQSLPGLDTLVIEGMGSPPFDYHAALMSLPLLCGTTFANAPASVPYLAPPADIAARWRERLAGLRGLRVGIVWAGGPKHPNDAIRSLDVNDIRPLLDVPGVAWVSLQKGDKAPDLARLGPGHGVLDLSDELHDFAETAGAVACLDLVVAVDTSVAHLSGALAKPVLLMLPEPPDFRWMWDRATTPWYPEMRIFRQPSRGDWAAVIAAVRAEVAKRAAAKAPPAIRRGPLPPTLAVAQAPRRRRVSARTSGGAGPRSGSSPR